MHSKKQFCIRNCSVICRLCTWYHWTLFLGEYARRAYHRKQNSLSGNVQQEGAMFKSANETLDVVTTEVW